MSKYGVEDKVVIRNDLVLGEGYGGLGWFTDKEYLKQKDYVVIEEIDDDGDYLVEGYWINDEMISHRYGENKYSDPTLVEIITDVLDRLENAYDNKKFIPITTMHLLVLQRLVNDAGFDYKFKEISKINTK